jgi:glycerol-3-phosphate dehydrogenase
MFDVCIIGGGGIVGCAIARELALRGLSVAAVEKHDAVCRETSGLNSRVIHSGFHEVPDTLKAALARAGSALVIQYARERAIGVLHTGMLIAVPHGAIQSGVWREATSLWNLWKQGRKQHIKFRFVLTPESVRKIAPIQALGGIFIPTVCVIDLEAFAESLVSEAMKAGASYFFQNEVVAIAADDYGYVVKTAKSEVCAYAVVNSAGLAAPAISRMEGGPSYEIELLRGDYYELVGGVNRWGIQTLVYPAMPPGSSSKGIHFGPRTDGRLYIGPSASRAPEAAPKQVFLEAAQRFIPDIRDADLKWAYAGTRPKNKSDGHNSDFIIRADRAAPPLINLVGIDSPGLSSSLAIANYVAEMITPMVSRKTS